MEQTEAHLTVEDIYGSTAASDIGFSLSSICSNLRGLVDAGVIEFRKTALGKLKTDIAQEYGFSIADCRVEFYSRANK